MKLKNTIKKVAVAALLATPLVSSVVNTNTVHAASWVAGSKFYNDDIDDGWNEYKLESGSTSWRNFKTRSANIYVKDKSLLPATKKAIKFWSPVFKFKLVKSAKHASFHSKKYANVVIYDENYETIDPTGASLTSTRVYENKDKKVIKYVGSRYQPYANDHLNRKTAAYADKYHLTASGCTFAPKDWKKKAFTNHMNMVVRTKNNSQQAITNKIIANLGSAIGLGDIEMDNPNPTDIMSVVGDNYFNKMSVYNKTYHLTQADKDHIDWIYSHPYTGEVNIYHQSEAHHV